jgi:hypothetical protein
LNEYLRGAGKIIKMENNNKINNPIHSFKGMEMYTETMSNSFAGMRFPDAAE